MQVTSTEHLGVAEQSEKVRLRRWGHSVRQGACLQQRGRSAGLASSCYRNPSTDSITTFFLCTAEIASRRWKAACWTETRVLSSWGSQVCPVAKAVWGVKLGGLIVTWESSRLVHVPDGRTRNTQVLRKWLARKQTQWKDVSRLPFQFQEQPSPIECYFIEGKTPNWEKRLERHMPQRTWFS